MKKLVSLLLICFLTVSTLSSCKPKEINKVTDGVEVLKIVYAGQNSTYIKDEVERIFKQKYPDVRIEYVGPTMEDSGEDLAKHMENIAAETMAGKGPDLYIFDQDHGGVLPNILKTIKAGAFADINDLFRKDKGFNRKDYLEPALEACEFDGKQYLFPVGITSPFYFSSERALDEMGFDLSNCNTSFGLFEEIDKYISNRPSSDVRRVISESFGGLFSLTNCIDYKTGEIAIDTPKMYNFVKTFKDVQEDYKVNYLSIQDAQEMFHSNVWGFKYYGNAPHELRILATFAPIEKAVLVPTYNSKGEVQVNISQYCAISNNSQKKQMAYDYMMLIVNNANVATKELGDNLEVRRMNINENVTPSYKPWYDFSLKYCFDLFETGVALEGTEEVECSPFPEEIKNQYENAYDLIDVCTISPSNNQMLYSHLQPYFNGELSLETCLKKAQAAMEIYISE